MFFTHAKINVVRTTSTQDQKARKQAGKQGKQVGGLKRGGGLFSRADLFCVDLLSWPKVFHRSQKFHRSRKVSSIPKVNPKFNRKHVFTSMCAKNVRATRLLEPWPKQHLRCA
jgi:hypothetical protein